MFVVVFSNDERSDNANMTYAHGGLEDAKKLARTLSQNHWATVLGGATGQALARYMWGTQV